MGFEKKKVKYDCFLSRVGTEYVRNSDDMAE